MGLFTGGKESGFGDGIGAEAKFNTVAGLVCKGTTGDGTGTGSGDETMREVVATLYATDDGNSRIRMIDTKTQAVTTVAGSGALTSVGGSRQLVFDRSPASSTVKTQTILFITSFYSLRRFDLTTGQMSTCVLTTETGHEIDPHGLAATPTGRLILGYMNKNSIYAYDPARPDGMLQLLAGSGSPEPASFADGAGGVARFKQPWGVVVVDSEWCAYVSDSGHKRVRHMTLRISFVPAKHCDSVLSFLCVQMLCVPWNFVL